MSSTMLTDLPLCMVTLNPKDLRPISCNAMFEEHMGPLYRFQEEEFVKAASDKNEITPTGSSQKSGDDEKKGDDSRTLDSRLRLREAIAKLTFDTGGENKGSEEKEDNTNTNNNKRVRVRDIEMTTLTGDSGFPVRRYFDWFISKSIADNEYGEGEDIILLLGDPCTERDVDQREKDAELIDFFQNAPIALHWLTGDGKVLWANQTELNVLGYTAEEYIGKPIMNFCPDEQELVLEIFKQLGSGNAIRDVPVRFRTKDGKLVYLLIDSNIRYEPDGSFGHTRCFIRDDTGRKIREARASLLLEETKRSLKMLDNFMARSLHHMRTPLHVTQSMADAILLYLQKEADQQKQKGGAICSERAECIELCKMAGLQIKSSVDMLTDTEDLAKFDQGSVLHLHPKVFDIEKFGRHLLTEVPDGADGVDIVLELAGGGKNIATKVDGPSMVVTDEKVLKRVLLHLLDNAIDATVMGNVTLRIQYGTDKRLAIVVSDTGPGMDKSTEAAEGDLPPIFQRYHQELLPDDTADYSVASSIREKIEREINTHRKSKMGIGLSLSYHLVQELGGELRCTSSKQGTEFKFLLPRKASQNLTIPTTPYLPSIRVVREKKLPDTIDIIQKQHDDHPQKSNDDQDTKSTAGSSIISSLSSPTTKKIAGQTTTTTAPKGGVPTSFQMPTDILPTVPDADLAEKGIKSQDPPSVLIVEDTKMCAKMLTMILKKFGCSTKWVENGQLAVDELRTCTPGTYDLILMDLRMPVMDGLEATTLIKSELQVTTPVVALTGDFNEKTKQECEQIGFEDFRGKPMKRNDLKELIKTFTGYEVK